MISAAIGNGSKEGKGRGGSFAEAPAWKAVGKGWVPLFGSCRDLGFSVEWHEFECEEALDWSRSFHPGGLELCLNLSGRAVVSGSGQEVEICSRTATFYFQGTPGLRASRAGGERHEFITVEFSAEFLDAKLRPDFKNLHPLVQAVLGREAVGSRVSNTEPLHSTLLALVESLRRPPIFAAAQRLWFESKALEIAAQLLFRPPEGEFFCTRQQRAARERVEQARVILRQRMSDPPALEELGRMVSCSPFYLSRLFSQEVGMTIQQYIRQVRMEKAAELLRSGRCNVTEAAMEVGYNSLSHFSAAFHQTFGCCPGLYPLRAGSSGHGTTTSS